MRKLKKKIALLLTAMLVVSNCLVVSAADTLQVAIPPVDTDALINYYIQYLNVPDYIQYNPDLVEVFGQDVSSYILHYTFCGMPEGRKTGTWDSSAFIINNANEIYAVTMAGSKEFFDAETYRKVYPDVALAFGENNEACLIHYLMYGVIERRISGGSYDPLLFSYCYPKAAIRTNCTLEQYKKAFNQEKARALTASSSSSSSSGGSGGSSSSGGSGSSGNSNTIGGSAGIDNPMKPAPETLALDKYTISYKGEDGFVTIGAGDSLHLENNEGLSYEEVWAKYFGDSDLYICGYSKSKIVCIGVVSADDFTCNEKTSVATLKIDKNLFLKDIVLADGLADTITINYAKDEEESSEEETTEEESSEEESSEEESSEEESSEEESSEEESSEEESSEEESSEEESSEEESSEEESSEEEESNPTIDELSDDYKSMQFSIREDSVIQLPTTMQKLIDAGYYSTAFGITVIEPGEVEAILLAPNEESNDSIMIQVYNPFSVKIAANNGVVKTATVYKSSDATLPGGIKLSEVTRELITQKYGTPDAESDTWVEYRFDKDGVSSTADTDVNIVGFYFNEEGDFLRVEMKALVEDSDYSLEDLNCKSMSSDYKSLQLCIRNGDYIQLPVPMEELLNRGYYAYDSSLKTELQPEEEALIVVHGDLAECNSISISVYNPYDQPITVKEGLCYKAFIVPDEELGINHKNVLLPKNITALGSSRTDVIAKYGNPQYEFDDYVYYIWDENGSHTLDRSPEDFEYNYILFNFNEDNSIDHIRVVSKINQED